MALIMLILTALLLKYNAHSRMIMTMPDSMIENVLSLTLCFIFVSIYRPRHSWPRAFALAQLSCFIYQFIFHRPPTVERSVLASTFISFWAPRF